MEDIELVIKLPKEEYERLPYIDIFKLRKYIASGTPLPKGHGDLIDRNELSHKMVIEDVSRFKEEPEALAGLFLRMCDKEQPIIKADKGESEVEDAGSN